MGPVLIATPTGGLSPLPAGLTILFAAEATVAVTAADREPSAALALPSLEVGVLLGPLLFPCVLHCCLPLVFPNMTIQLSGLAISIC
jgi:hypothetical protein